METAIRLSKEEDRGKENTKARARAEGKDVMSGIQAMSLCANTNPNTKLHPNLKAGSHRRKLDDVELPQPRLKYISADINRTPAELAASSRP